MEPSTFYIGLIFILIIYGINKSTPVKNEIEELPPPYHPKETMMENYSSISEQITGCFDQQTLKDIYIRILIFQCCYEDSASFLSELYEMYSAKEKQFVS